MGRIIIDVVNTYNITISPNLVFVLEIYIETMYRKMLYSYFVDQNQFKCFKIISIVDKSKQKRSKNNNKTHFSKW